ncbi:hypothetical protein ICW40_12405 [Actinotalea ferrariae]|uniref:hypothetical protein n=1 Tax=Actinotalea ferrariae TaxID=1386098 RepID=UPI001C8B2948|nr:hypothetical protein [Actinotalea ferrariae]MBX9245603.1 hypothetical protein [Actinotalea ferrariae]
MTVQTLGRLSPLLLAIPSFLFAIFVAEGSMFWLLLVVSVVFFALSAIGLLAGRKGEADPAAPSFFAKGKFHDSLFEDNESEGTDGFIHGEARNSTFRRNRQRRAPRRER